MKQVDETAPALITVKLNSALLYALSSDAIDALHPIDEPFDSSAPAFDWAKQILHKPHAKSLTLKLNLAAAEALDAAIRKVQKLELATMPSAREIHNKLLYDIEKAYKLARTPKKSSRTKS